MCITSVPACATDVEDGHREDAQAALATARTVADRLTAWLALEPPISLEPDGTNAVTITHEI